MARTAKAPEQPLEELPPEDEVIPEDVAVQSLLSELAEQGVMVRIYRQGITARDLTLIDEMPVEQFNPMQLAYPPYDGGTFRIHARSPGVNGIIANRELKVQRKLTAAPATAPAAPAGITKAEVMELFDDRLERILARLQPPSAPVDPFANIEKLAGIIKLMMPAPAPVATVAPPPQPTLAEQLTTLKLVKDFIGESGGGEDGGIGSHLLKEGVGMVRDMVQTAQAQQRAPAQPQPAGTIQPVAALPNPAQPMQPELSPEGDEEMKLLWKLALKRACAAAKAGTTPADFDAEWGAMVPDEILDDLEANPEWFGEVCKINPDCQLYEPWFTELRELLLGEPLDNAEETAQASPSLNSDTADVQVLHGDSDLSGDATPPAAT